jgi:hypothetical protein
VADRRLAPDFKTIADFRHDNGKGIRNVCRRFVALCRQLKLLTQGVVAVDGSKFKAVNNRDRNFTPRKLQARMQQINESIERYLSALDTADRTEPVGLEAKTARLQDKLVKLRQQMRELRSIKTKLLKQPDEQLSLTDPDARSMATSGRGTGIVGYNVQVVADAKHHLIVAHDVVNVGNDRAQLWSMAQKAREAMGAKKLRVIADRGYFKDPGDPGLRAGRHRDLRAQADDLQQQAEGRFSKLDFVYIAKDDEYRCPAGQRLVFHQCTTETI